MAGGAATVVLARSLSLGIALVRNVDCSAGHDRAAVCDVEDDLVGFGCVIGNMRQRARDGQRVDVDRVQPVDGDRVAGRDEDVIRSAGNPGIPRQRIRPIPVALRGNVLRHRCPGHKGE